MTSLLTPYWLLYSLKYSSKSLVGIGVGVLVGLGVGVIVGVGVRVGVAVGVGVNVGAGVIVGVGVREGITTTPRTSPVCLTESEDNAMITVTIPTENNITGFITLLYHIDEKGSSGL